MTKRRSRSPIIRLLIFVAGVVTGVAIVEWLKRGFEEK